MQSEQSHNEHGREPTALDILSEQQAADAQDALQAALNARQDVRRLEAELARAKARYNEASARLAPFKHHPQVAA